MDLVHLLGEATHCSGKAGVDGGWVALGERPPQTMTAMDLVMVMFSGTAAAAAICFPKYEHLLTAQKSARYV